MAHWLVGHVGESIVTAREHVRIAAALRKFSLLRTEFAAGRLSYARVRAVSRVITESSEKDLVGLARAANAAQLERFARGVARVAAAADPDLGARQYGRRSLNLRPDDERGWDLRGSLPADVGEMFRAALQSRVQRFRSEQSESDTPVDQLRADALAALLRDLAGLEDAAASAVVNAEQVDPVAADNDSAESSEGARHRDSAESSEVGRACDSAESSAATRGRLPVVPKVDERVPLIVVHRYPDGCELTTIACPTTTAELLECEGYQVDLNHHSDGHPLNFGRQRRHPTAAQRRAVLERDQCCQFPGCGSRVNLQIHHVQWWSRGGKTDLSNFGALCPRCHPLIHHGFWMMSVNDDGTFRFARRIGADGRVLSTFRPPPDTTDIESVIEALEAEYGSVIPDRDTYATGAGIPIRPTGTGWGGFDLELAVWAHVNNEELDAKRKAAANN